MQIIGPDGTPIESAEQLQAVQQQRVIEATPAQASLPVPPPETAPVAEEPRPAAPPRPPVPVPTRAPSTTIDALEKEFQKKKQRELDQARSAGTAFSNGDAPRAAGEKVGRNYPCPCGSGKKFKKCHGTEA